MSKYDNKLHFFLYVKCDFSSFDFLFSPKLYCQVYSHVISRFLFYNGRVLTNNYIYSLNFLNLACRGEYFTENGRSNQFETQMFNLAVHTT